MPAGPPPSLPERAQVVVVGAGLSGLSCARRLTDEGMDVRVVDSGDAVGGRIRTDVVEGFRMDRGFQILLTAYSEVGRLVDLESLDLRPFRPGSLVWTGGTMERLLDPWSNPLDAWASARARVGSVSDKLRVARLRGRLSVGTDADCFRGPAQSTLEELREEGFSEEFIDTFFRPFLGGVFLERDLETSAHLFRYYFRCFALGKAVVPAHGMQRLPESIAAPIVDRITLSAEVASVTPGRVDMRDGRAIRADRIVIATDGVSRAGVTASEPVCFKPSVTSYFAAPDPPIREPILVLDGRGVGPVNHVAVMSNVAPEYATGSEALVAVSGFGDASLDPRSFEFSGLEQLRDWFGDAVVRWRLLHTYVVPHALPIHGPDFELDTAPPVVRDGIVVAGDDRQFGAIQGALLSGRRAAEAVIAAS